MREISSNWKKFFFITALIGFTVFLTISIWAYWNRKLIRTEILKLISGPIGYDLKYKSEKFHLFPYPGISLSQASVLDQSKEKKFHVEIEELDILISWTSLLLKNISIKKLKINTGNIEIYTSSKDTKKKNINPEQEKENILKSIRTFNLSGLEIHKLSIKWKDSTPYPKDQVYIKTFLYSFFDSKHLLDFSINHRQGSMDLKAEIELNSATPSLSNLEAVGSIRLKDFSIKSFQPYYTFFKNQDFSKTTLNGNIQFKKKIDDPKLFLTTDLKIFQFNFKEIPPSPEFKLNAKLSYHLEKNILGFEDVQVRYGDLLDARTNGSLQIGEKAAILFLDIQGEKVELLRSLQFILSFLILDLRGTNPNYKFKGELLIVSKQASFDEFELKYPKVNLYIQDSLIKLDIKEADVLHGKIHGSGIINAAGNVTYDFSVHLQNINLHDLIGKFSEEEWIDGKLSGSVHLVSKGTEGSDFINSLTIDSDLKAQEGQLLGYANFFKPILALGKFMNIRGPKGKSTEFQSLEAKIQVKKKNIEIKSLKLIGVGIDATGKGNIDFDQNIQFRLLVGLGGIAGRAISIPIIYSGVIPNNTAYIDPVWLGSVYFGATLLGGPAGATAGGVAGSAISEYVRNVYEKLTGIFSSKEEGKK